SRDRLLWICLSRFWRDWRSALAIVKPETVVAWHRAGFRLFWTWKVRHGQPGRPLIPLEVRDLIRKMCRENPSWGAPRIHGELLKLGIDIGESSVSRTTGCLKEPDSTTLRAFSPWAIGNVFELCSLAAACIANFVRLSGAEPQTP
ncbi:MAG: hypothetical protein WBL63_18555, partial [Candidatus Acidiferrum sp.]